MDVQVASLASHVKALTQQAVSAVCQQEELLQQETLRGLEDKRTADTWRLIDLQERPLSVRSDVDPFVKGKRSKESGPKGTDEWMHHGKKGHWAGDWLEAKLDDGKGSSKGKGAANSRHCGRYGHKTCLGPSSTKPAEKRH